MTTHRDEFRELLRGTDDIYTLQDLAGMVGLTVIRQSVNETKKRIGKRLDTNPDIDPFDESNWVDPCTPTPGSDRLRVDRGNGVGEWDGLDQDDTFEA